MLPASLEDTTDTSLKTLCEKLQESSAALDASARWPDQQMRWLAEAKVFEWFLPPEFGGAGWTEAEIVEGYLALSASCMTTTFALTQWQAACKRILSSDNVAAKQRLLPKLASGQLSVTVGISHLTTSRQHLKAPVLTAKRNGDDFVLNGFSPWVTGAPAADVFVIGATLDDGHQILAAVPKESSGLTPGPGSPLVALSASCTDSITFDNVVVHNRDILAGPTEQVLQSGAGGGAGGLQTSTLAIGLSLAACAYLNEQSTKRRELAPIAAKMNDDTNRLRSMLIELSAGAECGIEASDLRTRANSLVLRSTQAALSAAKGAGFVASHPVGRWAREALFFLVWSCPQPVVNANLCELAQLD